MTVHSRNVLVGSPDSCWRFSTVDGASLSGEEIASLFARSAATVFQDPRWLTAIYGNLVPRFSARPLVLMIRERASGKLVALLPFEVRRYGLWQVAEIADFGVTDYAGLIVDADYRERLLSDPELPRLVRAQLRKVSLIHARKVRAADADLFALLGHTRVVPNSFSAHAARLEQGYEHWLAHVMNPAQRRSLERKRRKLSAKGRIRLEVAEDSDTLVRTLDAIREFREQRLKASANWDLLNDPDYASFYRQVASSKGLARAYTLYLDDVPLSTAFGIGGKGVFHMLLTGFNPAYRNYSVGLLVIQDAIRDCYARGVGCFDLTIGDQPYKKVFGTQPVPMVSLWAGLDLRGRLAALMLSKSPRALNLVRRFVRNRHFPAD